MIRKYQENPTEAQESQEKNKFKYSGKGTAFEYMDKKIL